MLSQVIIIIATGFDIEDIEYHSIMSLIIAIIFSVLLWSGFSYII